MQKNIKILKYDGSVILNTKGSDLDVQQWTEIFTTDRWNTFGNTVEIITKKPIEEKIK
jgi:hypothetical protein